jgi:hypothetical protein
MKGKDVEDQGKGLMENSRRSSSLSLPFILAIL